MITLQPILILLENTRIVNWFCIYIASFLDKMFTKMTFLI